MLSGGLQGEQMSGYAVKLPCGLYYHRGPGGRNDVRASLEKASRFATYEGAAVVAGRLGGTVVPSSFQLELFSSPGFPRTSNRRMRQSST
jgi:hypothetical protein